MIYLILRNKVQWLDCLHLRIKKSTLLKCSDAEIHVQKQVEKLIVSRYCPYGLQNAR